VCPLRAGGASLISFNETKEKLPWQFLFCSVVHFPPAPGWHTKSACPPSPPNFNVGVCDAGKTMWLLIRSLTWSTLKLGVRGPLGDFLAFVLRRTGAKGVTASTAYRIN
jgi:hypothetical protein